ncbi:hypothetical protein BDV59DRAFT_186364 [Aspergillus ambiguus]|uniref:uncharacterized protein n=1 Tax=Aspergillus ambiguus TaxID=176160 RepID=UPI003CCDADF6
MPSAGTQPPLNPTVEEDREDSTGGVENRNFNNNQNPISWSELCAQHEEMLSSHLHVLNAVRGNVTTDSGAFQMATSMARKTDKLVTQFKVLKKQIMTNRPLSDVPGKSSTESSNGGHSTSTPSGHAANPRKRRGRPSENNSETDKEATKGNAHCVVTGSQKRKRLDLAIAGDEEDVRRATPVSAETEDISEEVQRRLEIKEEQRRKRDLKSTKEKRKRLSSDSAGGGSSPASASKARKRSKVGMSVDQTITVPWEDHGRKRAETNDDEGPSESTEVRREAKRRKETMSMAS